MGFTPSLVSGCWVGGEDPDIHFDTMAEGQGAAMALPIWGLYMQKVFADKSLGYDETEKFKIPEDFHPCGSAEVEDKIDTTPIQSNGLDDLFN
jgi:penicillin-binding protein 1A